MSMSRWFAPAVLAAALGVGAVTTPAPVQAQDSLTRVLVDIADVVFRSGTPYYRNGDYGYNDRLIVGRDRYGRTVYYRNAPRYDNDRYVRDRYVRDRDDRVRYDRYGHRIYDRPVSYRNGPPYGNAYGYYRNGPGSRDVKCNKHGKCKAKYYDPRSDRDHDRNRWWDGRRWRYDD